MVMTAVGGIPEIVVDGEVGRLVRSRNPEEVATHLLEALDTEWDRQALRASAMRFSYETVAQQLLKLYESVMRKSVKA